jgi:diguanylate cyclase (GGDEF)-like protein/PAS domain S-box-containing protein
MSDPLKVSEPRDLKADAPRGAEPKEPKQKEDWLRLAQALLDRAGDMIFWVGPDGRFRWANRAAIRTLGYSREKLFGMVVWDISPTMSAEIFRETWAEVRSAGTMRLEAPICRKDGSVFSSEVTISHIGEGERELQFVIVRDISERKRTEEVLEEANRRLKDGIAEQKRRSREMEVLSEMVNLFHACRSEVEFRAVITRHVALLFPGLGGTLFAFNASRDTVEPVATWGGGSPPEGFAADDCWSLRRGRPHVTEEGSCSGCRHLSSAAGALCVPMVAQGETLGVLQLGAPAAGAFDEAVTRLAQATGESVALGLSNLRLREALRHLAIRDPLTGVFNRRYLEETIERELYRAGRNGVGVGVIALDIDHFKRFNDTFGHEAGDVLLKELGHLLRQQVRGADIPCRQGGEEFTLILPEANLEVTQARAEEIRAAARALNVPYRGQILGTISVSLGVAMFSEHGVTPEALLRAADAALYCAKEGGRDRVALASAV